MIKNVGKYFYRYVLGYRYDHEIIDYFKDPYRNAIQTLYKEGYEVEEEYTRLFTEYQSRYSPLNAEELSYFISKLIGIKKPIFDLEGKLSLLYQRRIIQINSYLLMNYTRSHSLEVDYKNQINMLSLRSDILSKEIKKINPVYRAVIIRKLVKLLEEKLIYSFIHFFDVQNFYPSLDILIKYKEKLINLEFKEKSKYIKKIDEIMVIKSNNSNKNKDEKIKPKLRYLTNNKITKIEKILYKIRLLCNNIIHFSPNKEVCFNLDKTIFEDTNTKESKESQKNTNIIVSEVKENDSTYIVSISKVVDYIINANLPNEVLDKLYKLKQDYDIEFSSIFTFLSKDENYKKLNSINIYEKIKKDILDNNDIVENLMKKIRIPEVLNHFRINEIRNIINYINSNKYNYKEISIPNCEKKEKNHLLNLNKELNKYDIYSRIKFNLTLERNMELIEFKKELDNAISTTKTTDDLLKRLNELKLKFKEKFNKVKQEASLINDCLITFDYSNIFNEISVEEFAEFTKKQFTGVNIDLFGKEINNLYLYIYFLKNGIFNEKAYKSTIVSNDDFT